MLALILAILLSLEADFVQTKQIAMMTEKQVSKGHLSYRSPNTIRWEYTKPQSIIWEMSGKQSNVNPQIQGLLHMIMSSVSGTNLQSSSDFQVTQEGNVYTLIPRKREYKHLFRKIVITLNSSTKVAQQVELFETNNSTTLIEFHNVVTR